ncbi:MULTISPECIES: LysR family transcriptional regulator [unclassified Microbacterium]|uniref:LysR family transcriptional regulator n=1 Tax=unclassified Microbacterium TaxID=2609290 RepID=UPI00365E5E24
MLDVRKLLMLRAVVAEGSIAAAARSLAYTRSAVSQQLSALEAETGVALLERTGRRVTLTAAGTRLLEHTERVLVELRAAESALHEDRDAVSGVLRVGIPFREGPRIMSRALTALRREHPQLQIRLLAASDEDAADQVLAGRLDVAITSRYSDAAVPRAGLVEWEVGRDELRVCVARSHRLADRDACPMSELRGEEWVLAPDSMLGRLSVTLCVASGFEPNITASVTDVSTAVGLVGLGWGVTIAPERTPDPDGVLHRLRIEGAGIERRSLLMARDGEQTLPRIAAVVAAVRAVDTTDAALGRGAAGPRPRP